METVQTADGRTLAFEAAGDLDGHPVLVHVGTPYSRHLYDRVKADASGRGLRLISYDRPGYGGSTPGPGRSVADCAGDVRLICTALGIDRLAMWGFSGGGPHVLACAALLPDLVVAAASLASFAPPDAEGLHWLDGMGDNNRTFFQKLRDNPDIARGELEKTCQSLRSASASDLAERWKKVLTDAEREAMRGGLGEYLAYSMRQALAPGSHASPSSR